MPLEKSKATQKAQAAFQDLPKVTRPIAVRLHPQQIEVLRNHFESKGLRLAQGLRMVVYEYMTGEGLI